MAETPEQPQENQTPPQPDEAQVAAELEQTWREAEGLVTAGTPSEVAKEPEPGPVEKPEPSGEPQKPAEGEKKVADDKTPAGDDIEGWLMQTTGQENIDKAKETVGHSIGLIGRQGQELGEQRELNRQLSEKVKALEANVARLSAGVMSQPGSGNGVSDDGVSETAKYEADPISYLRSLREAVKRETKAEMKQEMDAALTPMQQRDAEIRQANYRAEMARTYPKSWEQFAEQRTGLYQAAQKGEIGGEEIYHRAVMFERMNAMLKTGKMKLVAVGPGAKPSGGVSGAVATPGGKIESQPGDEQEIAASLVKEWAAVDDGIPSRVINTQ